jgi:hypothetical protein
MDRAGGPPWGHARGAVLWMGEQGLRLSGDLRCEQSRAAGCLMPQAVAIDLVATHLARCAVQCSDPGGPWAFGMISLPWQSVPPGAWRGGRRGGTVVRWWRHNRGPFALICVHLRQKFLACWRWCGQGEGAESRLGRGQPRAGLIPATAPMVSGPGRYCKIAQRAHAPRGMARVKREHGRAAALRGAMQHGRSATGPPPSTSPGERRAPRREALAYATETAHAMRKSRETKGAAVLDTIRPPL